jgi:hypothetical protein
MPSPLKFFAPLRLDLELRQRAHREGRTLSDVILRAVERGMAASPTVMPNDTAIVDQAERGTGGKATAAYLSPPLASAIQHLAAEQRRSASWVMRDLIRSELRHRGVLPTPPSEEGQASAWRSRRHDAADAVETVNAAVNGGPGRITDVARA